MATAPTLAQATRHLLLSASSASDKASSLGLSLKLATEAASERTDASAAARLLLWRKEEEEEEEEEAAPSSSSSSSSSSFWFSPLPLAPLPWGGGERSSFSHAAAAPA